LTYLDADGTQSCATVPSKEITMSVIQASTPTVTLNSGLSGWMKRHPLIAYFSMAYAGRADPDLLT
jgi:hypothetical protein